MIDIKDGQIIDIMPEAFTAEPESIAISYAIKAQIDSIMEKVKGVYLYSQVDILPEYVLDVMAMELRTQYYDEALDIETKRELVKNALKWHSKAGTPQAVQELAEKVFGQARVTEWFDFDGGGTPGMFDITTNAPVATDSREQFTKLLADVKNVRSHLRYILYENEISGRANAGGLLLDRPQYILQ